MESKLVSLGTSIFFGSFYKIAQLVGKHSNLKKVICEKQHFNLDLYNYSMLHDIDFILVEKKDDLAKIENSRYDVGVSCGTGLIFKKQHIEIFKKGIWNIHYGPLPEIRGRHPISWGFIENMEFGVSIHQINEEIDKGILLAKAYVERDIKDTQIEIEKKIEEILCNGLLYKAIINWHQKDNHILGDGKYFSSLENKFNSIDPVNFSSKFIFNLFKSQYKFGGVIVNKTNFKQCSFYNENFPELYEDCVIFTCQDGVLIALN